MAREKEKEREEEKEGKESMERKEIKKGHAPPRH